MITPEKRDLRPMEIPKVDILLVDDHPDELVLLETVLSSPDYNLVKARSGQEAIASLKEHDYAVILLDVQMPEMDGLQTAARIKQTPEGQGIPILFLTSTSKETLSVHKGYGAGGVDYLFRPFDPYILQSKVAVFVELYRRTARLRDSQSALHRKEEELYQTRKMEAIGRLAGGVAHDFNNIVTGILGITEEMREALKAGNPQRDDLDEIIKATHRAFALTRQLLAYARRQVITPVVLNLNNVVAELKDVLSRLIGEGIHLKTDVERQLDAIKVDRGYLEQVLINLALNGRDAMPDGGTLTVKAQNVELTDKELEMTRLQLSPGFYVLLTVSDSGNGMSQEALDHVFEPFFTTKDKDKGTGLGLATVYGIVKQNGGDIVVYSGPKSGTRMDIYFPRAEPETACASAQKKTTPACRGSETILVVEDERLVRRVVGTLLRKTGYTVLEAANGPEALALCENYDGPVHLLVTDVVMPEMNGRQVAASMIAKYPGIPVLYMSGYTEDLIAHEGVLDPGISFIEKSMISRQLTEKVRQVLSSARERDEAPVN